MQLIFMAGPYVIIELLSFCELCEFNLNIFEKIVDVLQFRVGQSSESLVSNHELRVEAVAVELAKARL